MKKSVAPKIKNEWWWFIFHITCNLAKPALQASFISKLCNYIYTLENIKKPDLWRPTKCYFHFLERYLSGLTQHYRKIIRTVRNAVTCCNVQGQKSMKHYKRTWFGHYGESWFCKLADRYSQRPAVCINGLHFSFSYYLCVLWAMCTKSIHKGLIVSVCPLP
jgi:hypothetical protein